jgi:Mrp family chromosome partitioning ATPase
MRAGRRKLPVLAEVSGFEPGEEQVWSLRAADFARLTALNGRLAQTRCLLVTGAAGLGGPLAIALAGVAGAAGRRTALVECDLTAPRMAADLGLEPAPGVHEYLRWEAQPEQILQPLSLAGAEAGEGSEPLVFVAAGRPATDATPLLGLRSFGHMTAKLRGAYELVVLVGPPPAQDGAALASVAACADGVLAAVGPGQASGRAGRALRAALGELPVPPLGAVVVGAER